MRILLIIVVVQYVNAHLNLYLDSDSTLQLFDSKEYQLYFISKNEIRQSVLKTPFLVTGDVHFIQFTWNQERSDISTPKLHYEYTTSSANEQSLLPPVLNIQEQGIVPKSISTFSVIFPCLTTDQVNASVLFRFYNTKTKHSPSKFLNLTFSKYCDDESFDPFSFAQFSNLTQIEDYFFIRQSRRRDLPSITIATILLYSLVVAAVVFVLVFCTALSLFCIYRISTRKKKTFDDRNEDNNQDYPMLPTTFDMTNFEDVSLYSCTQYDFLKKADEILSSATFADCTIDSSRVALHEVIMEGQFGFLLHCSLNGLSPNVPTQNAFGKTMKSSATPTQLNQMLHDCCLFATVKHSTLNSPLGIVYKDGLSPYPMVVYPYSSKGILKCFLSQNRINTREKLLSTQELVYMSIHVGKGLHFLHRRKILMKDIGTRNCLVMDDLTVKLMDYALSRDLFPQDYDFLPMDVPTESRPLKFMAIESIKNGRFSTASDVWSYGVLLWEMMSRGLQPYADIESYDLLTYLENNNRLLPPMNCPDSLFKLMSACWVTSIDQRPSMTSLLQLLVEFYGQLARFI